MRRLSKRMTCDGCGWSRVFHEAGLIGHLRRCGMLRREADPEPEFIEAILSAAGRRIVCPECGAKGVRIGPGDDAFDDDWGDTRLCVGCGRPIPHERLEIFPDAEYCAQCRGGIEQTGTVPGSEEYCPHCGSIMQLRRRGGDGMTRYQMWCPSCRRSYS